MIKLNRYQEVGWVLLTCALFFFIGNGNTPLFDLDEGAFSAATMEMLQRQNYITTYLNGELRFDKPILIYWLQAASVTLWGLTEFSLRLPSALMASFWVISLYVFCRSRMTFEQAITTSLLLGSATGVVIIGRAATADALLNALLCFTLLDAYRIFENQAQRPWIIRRAYLWIGLGLLAKGPVAILIPLATITLYAAVKQSWKTWWAILWSPSGWLITLAVAAPWYLLEYKDQGQAFIDGFFLKHNLARFNSTFEGHGGHWLYYFGLLPLVLLPNTGLLIRSLGGIKLTQLTDLQLFGLCWIGFVFTFFSLSGTQLPHYILYGITGLSLFIGPALKDTPRAWLLWPSVFLIALYASLPILLEKVTAGTQDMVLQAMIADGVYHFDTSYYVGLIIACLCLAGLYTVARQLSQQILGISCVHTVVLTMLVLPAIGNIQQGPTKEAAILASTLDLPVGSYQLNHPSFSVYLGQPVPRLKANSLHQEAHLLITKCDHDPLPNHYEILFSKGCILLLQAEENP